MVERVSDFKMPEKVVTKLLKDALPDNVLVSKDAKNAACRSASIFILQLSIAAAEKAQMNGRRTLENQDIIKAVTDLGLSEYAPQLVRFGAQRKRNARRRESGMLKTKPIKKMRVIEYIPPPDDDENPESSNHEQEHDNSQDLNDEQNHSQELEKEHDQDMECSNEIDQLDDEGDSQIEN